jgi:ABC-2 type transport system ATP-binding protein
MSEGTLVEIRGLVKDFDGVRALDGIDLDLERGQIVGLVGANGSGKSTLLRHVIGLYLPTDGSCRTCGREARDLGPAELARLGYVHQEGELLDYLTVDQHVRYVASYYPGWNRALEGRYRERFALPADRRVGDLSPGLRQRLATLLAIGHEPDLLLLDEPAAALDPLARREYLDLLVELIQEAGRTIVVSSHILSDIEQVIDHVVIMDRGRILRDSSLDDLREEYCRVRLSSLRGPLPADLPLPEIREREVAGGQALLTLDGTAAARIDEIAAALGCRAEIVPLSFHELYRLVLEGHETGRPAPCRS